MGAWGSAVQARFEYLLKNMQTCLYFFHCIVADLDSSKVLPGSSTRCLKSLEIWSSWFPIVYAAEVWRIMRNMLEVLLKDTHVSIFVCSYNPRRSRLDLAEIYTTVLDAETILKNRISSIATYEKSNRSVVLTCKPQQRYIYTNRILCASNRVWK